MGVKEVQIHEPALVLWDSSETLASMYGTAYSTDKVKKNARARTHTHPVFVTSIIDPPLGGSMRVA